MTKASTALLFCTVFSIVSSLGTHASGSEAVVPSVCTDGKLPLFKVIAKSSTTRWDAYNQINTACEELERDEIVAPETLGNKAFEAFAQVDFGLLFGTGAAAFATLNGNETQRKYKAELERIKTNPDPLERIRQVYELAARHSGSYDYETMGKRTGRRGYFLGTNLPGNLIDTAKETGSIGVCREYANLLVWSLMQVARYKGSKSMQLAPTDFSANLKLGFVGGGHAWVRVNLPQFDSRGAITGFVNFDLDTTWYGDYSPLFPRRSSGLQKARARAQRECMEVINCLF